MSDFAKIELCNKSAILKFVDFNIFYWNILTKDNINKAYIKNDTLLLREKKWIYLLTLVTVLLEIFFYWKLNVPFVKIPLFLCMWKVFFIVLCVVLSVMSY